MFQAAGLVFFWVLAALSSPDTFIVYRSYWAEFLMIVAATLCLFFPLRKAWPFFLVCQVFIPLFFMPLIGNNVSVRAIFVLFILLEWLWVFVRNGKRMEILGIIKANAQTFRVGLLLIYFISGVHKLNSDFLNPDHSCVRVAIEQVFSEENGGFLPTWIVKLGVVSTLALELVFPLFLFFSRTRPVALVAFFIFHLFLGFNYLDFSLTQLGLLCFFVPNSVLAQLGPRVRSFSIQGAVAWCLVWLGAVVHHLSLWSVRVAHLIPVTLLLGAFFNAVRLGLLKNVFRLPVFSVRKTSSPISFFPLMALVVLGLSPYAGVRTWATLSMFSNLRVQNGNNHLFMPKFNLISEGEHLVEIDGTDSVFFQTNYIRESQLIAKIDLERIMSIASRRGHFLKVTFHELNSSVIHRSETDSRSEAEALERRPLWQKMLVAYRPVPKSEKALCHW